MTTEKERRRKGFSRVAPRVFDWEEGGGRDSYLQPHEMGDDCCRSQEGGGDAVRARLSRQYTRTLSCLHEAEKGSYLEKSAELDRQKSCATTLSTPGISSTLGVGRCSRL